MSLVLGLGLEHSCPWPREGLSSERLSLASDFFCVLGLEPCVLDSTSAMKQPVAKISNHLRRLETFASDVSDHSRRLANVANLRFALLRVQSKRTFKFKFGKTIESIQVRPKNLHTISQYSCMLLLRVDALRYVVSVHRTMIRHQAKVSLTTCT